MNNYNFNDQQQQHQHQWPQGSSSTTTGSTHTLRNSLTSSPHSKRNTKNLSLQLTKSNAVPSTSQMNNTDTTDNTHVPLFTPHRRNITPLQSPLPGSPSTAQLYRHPSLSRHYESSIAMGSSAPQSPSSLQGPFNPIADLQTQPMRRRTTLSLSIPAEIESSSSKTSSSKLSSNSIPSFSSSSPITSSPIVPATPDHANPHYQDSLTSKRSSNSSSSTLKTIPNANGEILKTQTLIQSLSSMDISDETDNSKIDAYPNGPVCVLEPNLYLYSEPTLEELEPFDLIINVAKECVPPFISMKFDRAKFSKVKVTGESSSSKDYVFAPWTHTSKLRKDLPVLTDSIQEALSRGDKVLVHCQCGVSRSASLIVAYFMKLRNINLNDAYNLLKDKAPEISPNMSLIFQLMEWGEVIGVNNNSSITNTPTTNGNNDNNMKTLYDDDNFEYSYNSPSTSLDSRD